MAFDRNAYRAARDKAKRQAIKQQQQQFEEGDDRVIHMDDVTENEVKQGFKRFGDYYFRRKNTLVKWLSAQRVNPLAPDQNTRPDLFERNSQGLSCYVGNPNIKAPHQQWEYTDDELREFKRCLNDPIYFAETYVRILHVDWGEIPLTQYPFQRDMINTFNDNRFTICKLPRQCGKTTTATAYILWFVLFHPAKTVGILANKGELAQEILSRLQLAYERLPFWLQQGALVYNKRSMELENGSKIIATTSSGSAARGMSFSLLMLDEFAFVEPHVAEEFFRSVYPTISSGADTRMIIVSTPKGMNHFYRMWTEAIQQRSQFAPVEINWWDIPGRDEEWKAKQIANTSEDSFRQEFECQFIGSGNTLISPRKLGVMSYIQPIKSHENVDYYEMPRPGHTYMLVADTARGMRLDYSAFVVLDISTVPYKLVAKFRNNEISPMIYPYFINNIGRYYNNAYVLMELNDAGEQAAVSLLNDHEYENILRCESKGASGYRISLDGKGRLGVMQSVATKTKGCSNLKSMIEADKLIVEDFETYMELTTFVKKEINSQKFEAEPGCHDDLVICLVLFAWAAGSEEWKAIMGGDVARSMYGQKVMTLDDLMPVGFLSLSAMQQTHIDTQGQVWQEARASDPPDWYKDLYQNYDPLSNF